MQNFIKHNITLSVGVLSERMRFCIATTDFNKSPGYQKRSRGFFIALPDAFRVSSTSRKGLRVVSLSLNRLTLRCTLTPSIVDRLKLANIDQKADRSKFTEKTGSASKQALLCASLPAWVN
jgi:hypothetical protein